MRPQCSIEDCTDPVSAKGWCGKHYARWKRNGDPERRKPRVVEDFWSFVDKSGECWLWTGARNSLNYGRINDRGRELRAHRVSWELTNGPIPDGQGVLHHCDNPPCVRPDHLFLGTDKDNVDDMVRKGRFASVLTAEQASEAKRLIAAGHSSASIARAFGVSDGSIRKIAQGKSWKHVA